jgi:hypothetical protein
MSGRILGAEDFHLEKALGTTDPYTRRAAPAATPYVLCDVEFDAEEASGVCSSCPMADRLAALAAIGREAIPHRRQP